MRDLVVFESISGAPEFWKLPERMNYNSQYGFTNGGSEAKGCVGVLVDRWEPDITHRALFRCLGPLFYVPFSVKVVSHALQVVLLFSRHSRIAHQTADDTAREFKPIRH